MLEINTWSHFKLQFETETFALNCNKVVKVYSGKISNASVPKAVVYVYSLWLSSKEGICIYYPQAQGILKWSVGLSNWAVFDICIVVQIIIYKCT